MSETSPFLGYIGIALFFASFLLFFYLYNKKFEPRFSRRISVAGVIIGVVLLFLILTTGVLFPNSIHREIFNIVCMGVILLLYLFIFRKGTVPQKMFWYFVSEVIYLATSLICGGLSVLLRGQTSAYSEHAPSAVLLMLIFCIIQGTVYYMLAKKKHRKVPVSPLYVFILTLIPSLLIFMLVIWSDYSIKNPQLDMDYTMHQFLAGIIMAVVTFLVFILYENMLTGFERKIEQQATAQKAELVDKHNAELVSLYKDTEFIRHDLVNYVQTLTALSTANDKQALDRYLAELAQKVGDTHLKVNTGNSLLNAIIGTKLSIANKTGIRMDLNLNLDSEELHMPATDLSSLIGNLLDNAIEACQRMESGRAPFIKFSLTYVQGELTIAIKNSKEGETAVQNGSFITSKCGHGHGIGTAQIDAIVKKHSGFITREYDEHTFETLVRMNFIKREDIKN